MTIIAIGVFVLAVAAMRIMRYFGLARWQVSLGLLGVGALLYVAHALLMHHFIKKRAPELATDQEVAPGIQAWELTAGLGVVPQWVSFLGVVSISAFITAVVPWLIALLSYIIGR